MTLGTGSTHCVVDAPSQLAPTYVGSRRISLSFGESIGSNGYPVTSLVGYNVTLYVAAGHAKVAEKFVSSDAARAVTFDGLISGTSYEATVSTTLMLTSSSVLMTSAERSLNGTGSVTTLAAPLPPSAPGLRVISATRTSMTMEI